MPCTETQLAAWRAVLTAHAAVNDRVQKAFTAADLPPLSWFELMRAVAAEDGQAPRMSQLAEQLTLTRGGITKIVDRLEEAGYLERVSSPEDRRSFRARLTAAGERMLEEMTAVYRDEVGRYLRDLATEEARAVAASLGKITARTCDATATTAA